MDARILAPIALGAVRFLQLSNGPQWQNLLAAARPIVDFLEIRNGTSFAWISAQRRCYD
jgi:hypothetical protein